MADKKSRNGDRNKNADNKGLIPSGGDEALWREAMKVVTPLPEMPAPPETGDSLHEIRRIRKKLREKESPQPPPGRPARGQHGERPPHGLDRRTDDRLRRG